MSKRRHPPPDLAAAVRKLDLFEVRSLLAEGVSPGAVVRSRGQALPILYLALDASVEIVSELLRVGADPLDKLPWSETVLYNALRSTHPNRPKLEEFEMMREQLGAKFRPLLADPALLALAAGAGHIDLVGELLVAGQDPNAGLAPAAAHGRESVVDLLLDRGADIDRHGSERMPPAMVAATRGQAGTVRMLLSRGANPAVGHLDDPKWTLLHAASVGGLADVVAECIDRGDSVDALTKENETPIRMAIRAGHVEAVRALLEKGAAVNPPAGKRSTLIGLAYMAKRASLIPLLREYGASEPRRRVAGEKTAWSVISALRNPEATTALVVERIPDNFAFDQVTRLKRVRGKVRHWNPSVTRLSHLQKLHLPQGGLEAIGPEVGALHRLRELLLEGNRITSLPEALGDCTELRVLSLHENRLTSLPESLGRLTKLTALHLCDNRLTEFPETVTQLGRLTHLCLSRNLFRTLPPSIGLLTKLRELLAGSLRLREVPASIAALRALRVLDLSYNELGQFPRALLDAPFPALRKLDLAGNPIRIIPSLRRMPELSTLVLDGTLISELPDVSECPELTHLNVAGSGLRQIPRSIGNLSKLVRLDVSDTPVDALPDSLYGVASLKFVNLNDTKVPGSQVEALRRSAPWTEVVWHPEHE